MNAYTDNGEHGIGINSTRIKPDTKLISISSVELNTKANYQDFQRFQVGRRVRWRPMPKRRCRR